MSTVYIGHAVGDEHGQASGGVLVVHDVDGTLDKTWNEIRNSDFAVLKKVTTSDCNWRFIALEYDDEVGKYYAYVGNLAFKADTPDGALIMDFS